MFTGRYSSTNHSSGKGTSTAFPGIFNKGRFKSSRKWIGEPLPILPSQLYTGPPKSRFELNLINDYFVTAQNRLMSFRYIIDKFASFQPALNSGETVGKYLGVFPEPDVFFELKLIQIDPRTARAFLQTFIAVTTACSIPVIRINFISDHRIQTDIKQYIRRKNNLLYGDIKPNTYLGKYCRMIELVFPGGNRDIWKPLDNWWSSVQVSE